MAFPKSEKEPQSSRPSARAGERKALFFLGVLRALRGEKGEKVEFSMEFEKAAEKSYRRFLFLKNSEVRKFMVDVPSIIRYPIRKGYTP